MDKMLTFHFFRGLSNRQKWHFLEYEGGFEQGEPKRPAHIAEALWSSLWDQAAELAQRERAYAQREGYAIVTIQDPDYPVGLRYCPDPPQALMGRGIVQNSRYPLGIVGTRKPTLNGLRATRQLLQELAPYPVSILSGLAFGIDAEAHRHALIQGLPTVAFLAGGMGHLSPRSHAGLAQQLLDQGGGYFTEQPYEQPSVPPSFPVRNRLIAGASQSLVVVECARRSGALITARMAVDYGRAVFAVPGPWNAPMSSGPNSLLEQDKAMCLSRFSALPGRLQDAWVKDEGNEAEVKVLERKILALLPWGRTLSRTQLVQALKAKEPVLSAALTALIDAAILEEITPEQFSRPSILEQP